MKDIRKVHFIKEYFGICLLYTSGNSTNPTRFQHLVAGTYKKWANENGAKYFSVASGGGTGRTLHPDNMGDVYKRQAVMCIRSVQTAIFNQNRQA